MKKEIFCHLLLILSKVKEIRKTSIKPKKEASLPANIANSFAAISHATDTL